MAMFLMPPILIGAGVMWFGLWRASRPLAALLIAVQALQLAAFQFFVRVWGY